MMGHISLSAVFLLFFCARMVSGVCYCPWDCELKPRDVYCSWIVVMCTDSEAASECQKANWEISDMQSSLSDLVARFLDDALENKNLTALQAAYTRSLLSLAMEDEKPEGDCSNGLATKNRITGRGDVCFSPELLAQCAKVRDGVSAYQDGIPLKLEGLFNDRVQLYNPVIKQTFFERSVELGLVDDSDGIILHESVKEFLEIVRFRSLVKTARIRCASYDATTEEIFLASGSVSTHRWSLMVATAGAVAFLYTYLG